MAASSPSEGEAAVAAMLRAARQIFEGMRQSDSAELADHVRALHAEYEQHWSRVQAAAEMLDGGEGSDAPVPMEEIASAELDALRHERHELRSTLAARNRELKEQIDRLRSLLCAVQTSDT